MISFRAVATAAIALSGGAFPFAATPSATGATEGTVLSLLVKPDSARVDVVVGVRGDVRINDFVLSKPDRIVVDISNATLGLASGQSYDHASRGGIVNVHYGQNKPNVVRVVVSLDAHRPYSVSREADGIRISVQGATSNLPAWAVGYQAATLANAKPVQVFPKSKETSMAPPVIAPPVTVAPPVDAAPVRASTGPAKNPQMVVNGRPIAVPEMKQQSQQRRITVNFDNQDIRDVLKIFSEFSGHSILPSSAVTGVISASIVDVPWDVALQAILRANGYDALEDPLYGFITVDTKANLQKAAVVAEVGEKLTTSAVQFNYTSASTIAELLKTRLSRDCGVPAGPAPAAPVTARTTSSGDIDPNTGIANPPPVQQQVVQPSQPTPAIPSQANCPTRGAVTFDTVTNSVYITDTEGNVRALEAYARSLDKRQPQVNIKAKIILVDRTSLEALGIRYDLGSQAQFFNDIIPRVDSTGATSTGPGQISLGGNTISAIANASARIPQSALQLAYSTALGAFDFTTFVEALQTTSLLDVQSEPNGTTMNNIPLELKAGTQVPIRTTEPGAGANGAGNQPQVTVRLQQVGVILRVTPRVTNDNRIRMKIHVENSDVTFSGADAIAFPTQSVDNEVMLADGATWVIGGLTQTTVTSTRSGIPLLMELPVIGKLFGVTQRQETKRDLLILITPHIVDPGQESGSGRP